jgi:hypothetical protein
VWSVTGSGIATAALVVVGLILVLVGIFVASGDVAIIGLGVVALIAGGVLSVWAARRSGS